MTKKIIGNRYLIFSTIIILVWGVNFTLNTSLMFPILGGCKLNCVKACS